VPNEHYKSTGYGWVAQRGVLALVQGYGLWFANEISWRAERVKIAALCLDVALGKEKVARIAEEMEVPAMSYQEMVDFSTYAGIRVGI
jgi:hypothetical protein